VLVGHSLGSSVAAEMALRGHAARLVLLSPYTSVVDMARSVAFLLPVGLLVRDRYDTLAKTPRLDLPVLIVHGARDGVVPAAMGRRLGECLRNARVEIIPDGGHNDLFDLPGRDLVGQIVAFAWGQA
jgi:pimeloyl-ACP methyl ester carboxylesterase